MTGKDSKCVRCICSDEGLTLETSALKLFTVANLPYQLSSESATRVFSVKNFESRKEIQEWSFLAKIRQMLTQFTHAGVSESKK